jgi:heparanase 1
VILQYMSDFVVAMKGRLHAVTHHEYIEINATNVVDPAFLDTTYNIAVQVVAKIRNVSADVEVWVGETAGHNGMGGPGDKTPGNCGGNQVCGRWGSSLWYADAMASKARAGYSAFCRQDLIGADYGLTNFSTYAPASDYWILLLWQRLVGRGVLDVSSAPADSRVRVYAFCAPSDSNATLVIVNLASQFMCLSPPSIADQPSPRLEFSVAPADGTVTSAGALLDGVLLQLDSSGALPAMPGVVVPANEPITLAPLSVTFVTFATSADACMG